MKRCWNSFAHLMLCLSLAMSSVSLSFAQTETTTVVDPQVECAKNTAMEWSESLNKCVGRRDARATRHATEDCGAITDLEARKECHKKIAEEKTGLSSDVGSLPQGTVGKSSIINAAYTMINIISSMGSGHVLSPCTSKKIFAITSYAGTATDIWLKIQARKKMKALADKYQIEVKNNSYDSQFKAFQYLKEEQETVKDIASREKKRNMLLMIGYGVATGYAIYESLVPQANPQCYRKEETKPAEAKPEETKPEEAKSTEAKPEEVKSAEVKPEDVKSTEVKPDEVKLVDDKKDAVASASADITETPPKVENKQPPTQKFVAEKKNGTTTIRGVDANGNKTNQAIVGNRIIDNKTGATTGTIDVKTGNILSKEGKIVGQVDIQLGKTSTSINTSDFSKYGVYQSKPTTSAETIQFTNNKSGVRTSVKGTTTIINDSKIKKGK